jgi:hypothetical protein
MRKKMTVSMVMLSVFVGGIAVAEDRTSHVEGWEFVAAPYLWMAGIEGDVTIGGTKSSTDADFGDVLENLDTGAQGYFEMRHGKWGIFADITYMSVSSDAKVGAVAIDIESTTTLADIGVLYRAYEGFAGSNPVATDIFLSGRYVELDAGLDFAAAPDIDGNKNWLDPVVGATYHRDFSEKWVVSATGDIGGMGIGSDLTWSLRLLGAYRLNSWANLWFGYRYLSIDYDDGNGAREFGYDVDMHGPIVGGSFHF